jgi:3-isopropylmalate dehydratase small subunit
MEAFRVLDAIAVPIDEVNVDTNRLCPTRFNKVSRVRRHSGRPSAREPESSNPGPAGLH